jgi:hypothetical protein
MRSKAMSVMGMAMKESVVRSTLTGTQVGWKGSLANWSYGWGKDVI